MVAAAEREAGEARYAQQTYAARATSLRDSLEPLQYAARQDLRRQLQARRDELLAESRQRQQVATEQLQAAVDRSWLTIATEQQLQAHALTDAVDKLCELPTARPSAGWLAEEGAAQVAQQACRPSEQLPMLAVAVQRSGSQ